MTTDKQSDDVFSYPQLCDAAAYFTGVRQAQCLSSNDPHRLGRALTGLVIKVFRLNGDLLTTGDALVHDLGLTSARWQLLGAVALSSVPLPVTRIARNMGLTRQAVQRVVDDMRRDGLVRLEPNPHHRCTMLVAMTGHGEAAYRQASARQERRANDLAALSLASKTAHPRRRFPHRLERFESASCRPNGRRQRYRRYPP